MKLKRIIGWCFVLLFPFQLTAQYISTPSSGLIESDSATHSVKELGGKGQVYGHFRNYFMATVNQGDLADYWTNATGGALGYKSAVWKNFQFGIKGIFTYQPFSSDLNEKDKLAGKSARWEKQLYDSYKPEETQDLDRLEELFLRYHFGKKGFVEYGKLDINEGPLFRKWDSRMMPYVYKGLWSNYAFNAQHQFKGGWIQGVSPRGMTEWFSVGEAVGLLSNGAQPDGTPAHYHEATDSRGIVALNYTYSPTQHTGFQIWNYTFDKLMNITWLQADFSKKNIFGGLQYVHERAMPYQSQLQYEARYYQPDEQANVLNVKVGYQHGSMKLSGAYFHAFNTGRFLFPRELGLDGFYVTQSRNIMDGLGDTDVWMLRYQFQPKKGKWKHLAGNLRLSYMNAPGAENPQFNKHTAFNRFQTTASIKYRFEQVFEGLELVCLYVNAMSPEVETLAPAQIFYKSHFHHMNFMMNINF